LPAAQIQGHGLKTSGEALVADRSAPITLAAALPADSLNADLASLAAATARGAADPARPAVAEVAATPLDTLLKPAVEAQSVVNTTTQGRLAASDAIRANVSGIAAKTGPQGLTLAPLGAEAGHSKAVADFAAAMTAAGTPVSATATSAAPDATNALAGLLSGTTSPTTASTAVSAPQSGTFSLAPLVATPLQSPQWAADFSRQFVSITQAGHNMPHTAELRLDPPDLGPLRIAIQITDNVAHAAFVSPHAAVRQTVENALPQLQELLAQAGISLGQTSVSDQGQPGQPGQQGSEATAGPGPTIGSVAGTETGNAPLHAATRVRAPDALVDTFA
jgi:flagellar hook-length control protein FliK